MPDYSHILGQLNEMRELIDRLISDVSQIQPAPSADTSPSSATVASADKTAETMPQGGPSMNVILPTTGDEVETILGGQPTKDFPDCCAIGNEEGYFCTGTLIAPNLVATARHCRGVTWVFLKGYDIRKPDTGEIIRVKDEFENPVVDLRILVLEKNSKVKPRHIAQDSEVSAKEAVLVGFGTVNPGGTIGYGTKRMVKVPIVSLGCKTKKDQKQYGCQQNLEMVAGHRGLLKDTCRGDSGGPLYIESEEGTYHLLGVTSRGLQNTENPCGDGGIYVRVDQFLDWIHDQTGVVVEGRLD